MRVVHCKREPFDVYIGRPSPWENNYTHKPLETTKAMVQVASRDEAISRYENDLRELLSENKDFMIEKFFMPIAGKVLGCWCDPKPCHGQVLVKLCKELGLA